MNVTAAYRQSRDQLLRLREEHDRAVAEFRWPELGTRFNWAVDWFDAVASGDDRPARPATCSSPAASASRRSGRCCAGCAPGAAPAYGCCT